MTKRLIYIDTTRAILITLVVLGHVLNYANIILFALVAAIYLLSLVLTWLIRKIPFVGKKIT